MNELTCPPHEPSTLTKITALSSSDMAGESENILPEAAE